MLSSRHRAVKVAYEKGYRVQPDGSVLAPSGRPRKPMSGRGGYPKISVKIERKSHPVPIHVLAAYQLYGVKTFDEGIEVRHLNDDKCDSRPLNIAIGSDHDNKMDRAPEVRVRIARSSRKVTDTQVLEIHKLRDEGMTLKSIADRYGVVKSTVHYILNRPTTLL